MNKQFFTFLSLVLLFFCLVCNRSPSQPDEKINNPRNYTWTVDTLAYPGSFQTQMRCIWGSSAKDVYVVGHNDGGSGKMYHYTGDGMWHHISMPKIGRWIDLHAVFGFAENDVWTVGESHELITRDSTGRGVYRNRSLIFHYDGAVWQQHNVNGHSLYDVWGLSTDNVYAVGDSGTIFHYDGQNWSKEKLPYCYLQLISIAGDENSVFAAGVMQLPGGYLPLDTMMIFLNNSNGWQLIDKQVNWDFETDPRFGVSAIYSPEYGIYYCSTWGVFQWENSTWEQTLFSSTSLTGMGGSALDNVYAVGQFSKVYHWNGNDWALLTIPTEKFPRDTWFEDVWTDGKEAFICGHGDSPEVTYILHGK